MLIGYDEAASILGMTPGAVRAAVSREAIPHIRISDRVVRFDRDELIEWVRSRRVPARPTRLFLTMDAGNSFGTGRRG